MCPHREVEAALERWEREGLLSADQARALRAEAGDHALGKGRRAFQYVLASTGGLVVLIAAGVLAEWAWPLIGASGRSILLMLVAFLVHLAGLRVEARDRWRPASYLLQTAGLVVLLFAFLYSERSWADMSPPALAVGLAALVLPLVFAYRSVGRDPFMPAVHVALGFAFLALFLDRATPLSDDGIVWTLDGVLLVVGAGLVLRLRRAGDDPNEAWAVNAFVAALYAGFVLVTATGVGPLGLESQAVWGLDAWLAGVTALALWGLLRAPPALQRDWFGRQLALCVLLAVPLAFVTVLEALDGSPEAAALVVGALGGGGIAFGLAREERAVLVAGCLALLVAAWYYGIERGGALGGVGALAATAALLFWLSARLGRRG